MREYLFHGKRTDNGEWVEGYYVKAEKLDKSGYEHFIIEVNADGASHLVYPESVGEWTGLADNNSRKIFENDIVRCQERYDRPYSNKRKSKRHIGVVEYRVRKGDKFYNPQTNEWDRHMEYEAEWIVNVKDYGKFIHGSWGDFFDCEVIGNIFDNADLLEG